MTKKTYTIAQLRQLDEYPGIAYEQKFHFSRFNEKTIKHRDYHRNYSPAVYILMFFLFSISGWLWEVGIHVVEDGVFINRGTMHGPWLPIYGCGGVGALLVFRKYVDRQISVFVGSVALCGIAEYTTSFVIEKTQGLKYWDYNGYFLNLNGRICFEGMVVFGFACVLVIYVLAPLMDNILKKIPQKILVTAALVLCVSFAADVVCSIKSPNQGKGITDYSIIIIQNEQQQTVKISD